MGPPVPPYYASQLNYSWNDLRVKGDGAMHDARVLKKEDRGGCGSIPAGSAGSTGVRRFLTLIGEATIEPQGDAARAHRVD
jgi:hypothetical protein